MFKKHVKSISIIIIITIFGKILGFVRELVMAYFYGTGSTVDTFLMAESLPSVFFGWTTAFATAFVPIYQELKSSDVEVANKYTKVILVIVSGLSVVFVLIGIFFARQIISFGAAGFSEDQKNSTYLLYVICTLSYLYYSQIQLLTNYINCNGHFIRSSLATMVLSPIQTVFIIISFYMKNPMYMAIGVAVAYLAQLLIVISNTRDLGRWGKNKVKINAEICQTLKMAIPLFLSAIITRLNVLIDKMFASGLKEGSISALGYGETLRTVFFSLITAIIASMFYPIFSDTVAKGDIGKSIMTAREFIKGAFMLTIPLTVFGITVSKWGTAIIYLRGSFDLNSLNATSTVFSLYMFGLCAMTIRDICNNCMESFKDVFSPLFICAMIIILNVIMDYCFVNTIGYAGLPLATSLSNFMLVPFELWMLKKKMRDFDIREMVFLFMKIVAISMVTIIPILFFVRMVDAIFMKTYFAVKILMLLLTFVFYIFGIMAWMLKMNLIEKKDLVYYTNKIKNIKRGS